MKTIKRTFAELQVGDKIVNECLDNSDNTVETIEEVIKSNTNTYCGFASGGVRVFFGLVTCVDE